MKLFTTFQSLRFSLLKKEKFNEKNKFQPENRRGRAMEQSIFKSSCSFALKEDFLFFCFDRRYFMQACSVYLHWTSK